MMVVPPLDQGQRRQAVNPAVSVHVEAPAGSGKTTVLLERYLTILAAGTRPEDILALTFTRKAAGELRTRIQREFFRRSLANQADPVNPLEAQLQELVRAAWLRHVNGEGDPFLERLQIATFHSFCAQILRLVPHASGLTPGFRVMEEQEANRLQAEAVEQLRRQLAKLPTDHPQRQALVRRLVRLNNSWPNLAGELQHLLARRDILKQFIALARTSQEEAAYNRLLEDQLQEMVLPDVRRLAREFRQTPLGRQWPDLVHYLKAAGAKVAENLPDHLPGEGLQDLVDWVRVAKGILTGNCTCYRAFKRPYFPEGFGSQLWADLFRNIPSEVLAALVPFCNLPEILIHADEATAVQDLMILLTRLLDIYTELCAARRVVDFTALEEKALDLMGQGALPLVWSHLNSRYQHLLVDECQDTSKQQIEILCHLVAAWPQTGGQSLMVVGDPKQSIYGWRQARVELFLRTREEQRLAACPAAPPLEILTLETNFRSTVTLVEWVNGIFGRTIMPDKETGGVPFHAAVPRPEAPRGETPHLSLFVDADPQRCRRQEAAWLATELCRLQESLPDQETVGVLLFTRKHLQVYLEAWRQAGLNLRIRDGLPLMASRVVQHAHNVITALIRPHDDLAWAGLLRGFAGPQPLSLLAAVAACPGDFWSEKIRDYAGSAQGTPELRRFLACLDEAADQLGRLPLHELLANWLAAAGAWEWAARGEGAQGVANLKTYLDLLATAAAMTPSAGLDQVNDLLAQTYQPPDPRAQDAPIEVLTVHAAKGLEYDYVYLPFLDWQPLRTRKSDTPFLLEEIPGTGTAMLALNRPYYAEEQSVFYNVLKKMGEANTLGEARRLFYVAVTRAKRHLFLSGCAGLNGKGDWNFPSQSPLGWLRQHYADEELIPNSELRWSDPDLLVRVHQAPRSFLLSSPTTVPTAAAASPTEGERERPEAARDLPPALEIRSQRRPYEMVLPSALALDSLEAPDETEEPETDSPFLPVARARGELTHRLLEDVAQKRPLPPPEALAAELAKVVPDGAAVLALARDILAEVQACQADPFLAPLLAAELPVAKSEWLLEAWEDLPLGEGKDCAQSRGPVLYRGKIDRLVCDGRDWWLLDYKTTRPGPEQTWEEFEAAEIAKYRPQMEAYRTMAAKFFGLSPPETIKTVLYFTAVRRAVVL